jgi:hypothetical protein
MNILIIGLGCGFGGYAAYNLFTSALSDTLGLKTLRHGTGPCNYLSIQTNGARPELGGVASGEATLMDYSLSRHTENKFFVWEDDYYQEGRVGHDSVFVRGLLNCRVLHPIVKRLGPKYYTVLGGISAATVQDAPGPLRVFLQVIGGIGGLFTPVLDFHATPEEFERDFQIDENMVPVARYTTKNLKSWKYIGLPGVLYQGINKEVFSRIKQNPERFVKGIAKMLIFTVLVLSILSLISMYGHVPGLINVYSLIAHAAASGTILIPLSAGCGIAIPFVCLAIT